MLFRWLVVLVLLNFNILAIEDTYFKGEKLDIPYREQAVIVTKDGFYPNRLVVYKGEKVRFFVTAIGDASACFNIPSKNVFATAHQGKLAEAETFFENSGTYQFNCPNFQGSGRIMVIEKAADKEETIRRGLASDVIKVWQPKELPSEWVQIKKDELKSLRGMSDVMDLDTSEGK